MDEGTWYCARPAVTQRPGRFGGGLGPARARIGQNLLMNGDCGTPGVLVTDNHADVLASLKRGLRLSGFDVATARDGSDTLRRVSQTPSDAVVVDVNLAVPDGLGVVRGPRALDNHVPAGVLSARASVDDRLPGLEAGADDYLLKPFGLGDLVVRMRALLARRPSAAVVDVLVGHLSRKRQAGHASRLLHTVQGVGFVLRAY